MKKLNNFFNKSIQKLIQEANKSVDNLTNDLYKNTDITNVSIEDYSQKQKINNNNYKIDPQMNKQNLQKIIFQKPLQNIQLQQSKVISIQRNQKKQKQSLQSSQIKQKKLTNSRIKQIQDEKKRILLELKKLDNQIEQIKQQKNNMEQSQFHKKVKISDDTQAKRQAQQLIRQLHLQKKKIQQKKRRNQQKLLSQQKRQQEQRKIQRQQIQKRIKEQKRLQIQKRMQQDKKRKIQRQILDKQSNQLIAQLKKQQQFQKETSTIPNQIVQYQQKKKLLQNRTIFNISQIQEHTKKYSLLKSKEQQLRRQRIQSIKGYHKVQKYAKNVWNEKLEEEQNMKKQQQKNKQLHKKMQLQKRMKYGQIVKNILLSKQKKKQISNEKMIKQFQSNQNYKPKTPEATYFPQITKVQKRQNQTDKKFKQRIVSHQGLKLKKNVFQKSTYLIDNNNKKNQIIRQIKQIIEKSPEQKQKLQKQKQRETQLRKQTKQRLKKLESKSIQPIKPQKIKYQNYIPKLKIKKKDPADQWKKIMQNQNLSKQQKYQQMLQKAVSMQNQAKIKEDFRKNGDQDAVNLYIGSIQAKLALLQKF